MPEPFLTYLTVFQSRLGLLNLILHLCDGRRQPDAALLRKLRTEVTNSIEIKLSAESATPILGYLQEKGFLKSSQQNKDRHRKSKSLSLSKGRYPGLSIVVSSGAVQVLDSGGDVLKTLQVSQVDVWLADPRVPSTVATPTGDNVAEVLNLAYAFRVLFRNKNNVGSAWSDDQGTS